MRSNADPGNPSTLSEEIASEREWSRHTDKMELCEKVGTSQPGSARCCDICGNDEDTTTHVDDGLVWCPICLRTVEPGIGPNGINHMGPGI